MKGNNVDNISILGNTHIKNGIECQDTSISWKALNYCAVIICDGHGGAKHFRSAIGSQFACEIGKKQISVFMSILKNQPWAQELFNNNKNIREQMLKQLESAIIHKWNERVAEHFANNPFEEDERFNSLSEKNKQSLTQNGGMIKAYGTTFISVICTDCFFFILKLGDGNVVVFDKNNEVMLFDKKCPQLEDSSLMFNITTSLCNSNANISFRHYYKKIKNIRDVKGLVLTTDGIINCYEDKSYINLLKHIVDMYCSQPQIKAHKELANFLPKLSEIGSGDDLSVAIICKKQQYDKK